MTTTMLTDKNKLDNNMDIFGIRYIQDQRKYLIKRIWINPMEDRSDLAVGYSVVGFVEDLESATEIYNQGRDFTVNDCWAIKGDMPEFMYEPLVLIDSIK